MVSLQQLGDTLDHSIRELEHERRKEQITEKAFLVVRFTKASCDAFISIAADLGSIVFGRSTGTVMEGIDAGYGIAASVAQTASASVSGQKADYVQMGADVAKKGAKLVTGNPGYELATKSAVVKVEIVKNALNQDKKGVVKSAADYIYDLHTTVGDLAGYEKSSAFFKIAKDAFEYNERIGDAFNEMLEASEESEGRYLSLKHSLTHQAHMLSSRIDDLNDYISSCSEELGDDSPSVPITLP